MTFEQAASWLRSVGGTIKAFGRAEGDGTVIVAVALRGNGEVTRQGHYEANLTGDARQKAFERAFVEAVAALRIDLGVH